MADDADKAAEREEIARNSSMITSKKPIGPVANGSCHYCGERLPEPMRWCDADCRNDWERMRK